MKLSAVLIAGLLSSFILNYFFVLIKGKKAKNYSLHFLLGKIIFSIRKHRKITTINPKAAGSFLFYLTGILFSLIYQVLWSIQVGEPSIFYAILYGIIHGCLSIALLRYLQQSLSSIPYIPIKISTPYIFTGHILWALSLVSIRNLVFHYFFHQPL